jgi:hypothetical protein
MTFLPAMADTPTTARDPGAPIARDQIDPELVRLSRRQTQVGVVTALGLVVLCAFTAIRLSPDRRFAGSGPPAKVAAADIVAGKVATDQLVEVAAEPLVASALRVTKAKGSFGYRLAPVRGSHEALWLAISGDGDVEPAQGSYVGRLRKLDDLPLATAARELARHPRPVFATAAEVRKGLASGSVQTVAGEAVKPADADAVELDLIEPAAATVAASFNERLPDIAAWQAALGKANIPIALTGAPDPALGQVRFSIAAPVADTTQKLEAARLFDARVEPVTRHIRTTWGAVRASPPDALAVGGASVPDGQIDLLGLYLPRAIPDGAYAVVAGENPADYWYVLPITIALAAIFLVFGWALIRAVRRDLLPARAA